MRSLSGSHLRGRTRHLHLGPVVGPPGALNPMPVFTQSSRPSCWCRSRLVVSDRGDTAQSESARAARTSPNGGKSHSWGSAYSTHSTARRMEVLSQNAGTKALLSEG